jgi:hypothetical protein
VLTKLNEEKAAPLFLNNSIGETVTSVEFAKSSATVMMMNLVLSIRNGQPDGHCRHFWVVASAAKCIDWHIFSCQLAPAVAWNIVQFHRVARVFHPSDKPTKRVDFIGLSSRLMG